MKMFPSALCLALLTACSGGRAGAPPPNAQSVSPPLGTRAVQTPPPVGWRFPYHPNPFVVPICKSDPCNPQLDPSSGSEVSQMMNGAFSMGEIQEAEPGTNGQDSYRLAQATAGNGVRPLACRPAADRPETPRLNPTAAQSHAGSDSPPEQLRGP